MEAESEPGGRSLRSLKMHSHGEGHLRGRGGVGQEAAGRVQAQSDEPFFGRFAG